MAYSYGYDGENLYLSIPEPEYKPEDEPDEDRYLFPPLWLAGLMKKEGE